MKTFLIFFVFFAQIFAFELSDLEKIKHENISGKFSQIKKITGFERAIQSSGAFHIKNRTLFWHTQKPLDSQIKITSEGIFALQGDSWVKTSQSYDKGLFLSIINLDFAALRENFELHLSGDENAWILVLNPKGLIKNIFENIEIRGDSRVNRILLIEKNGDSTLNIFSEVLAQ